MANEFYVETEAQGFVAVPELPVAEAILIPGPKGDPGPVGPSSGEESIIYTVGFGGVKQFQVVYLAADGTVQVANAQNNFHAGKVVGITVTAAEESGKVVVRRNGSIENEKWSFSPGERLFLGAGGELCTTLNTLLFAQKIGIAESPTKMFIQIDPPIIL